MRTAKDDIKRRSFVREVARAIGAVTGWIGRPKDSDRRRSKSNGQMQRSCITTHDANSIAEKRHKLSERPIVSDRVSAATRLFDRGNKVLFAGAIVQYTTQSQS